VQGIRFHGLSITDCKKQLPSAKGGKEIILESMLWLLLTGKVPTEQQTRDLSRQLAERGELPQYAEKIIDSCVAVLSIHSYLFNLIGVTDYPSLCTQ
jgi:citrate synthase